MDTALRDILTAVREGRLDPAEGARRLQERSADAPEPDRRPPDALDDEPPRQRLTPDQPRLRRATGNPSASVWADVTDVLDPPSGPAPQVRVDPLDPRSAPFRSGTAGRRPARTDQPGRRRPGDHRAPGPDDHPQGAHHRRPSDRDGEHRRAARAAARGNDVGVRQRPRPAVRRPVRVPPQRDGPVPRPRSRVAAASRGGADLQIRVNPDLDIDLDVTAGSLHAERVGRLRARVTAGSARLDDIRGALDLHVVGGTAKIDTAMAGGDNRIRCDSGSILLRLRRGSNVRFRPEAQLGRIVVNGVEGGREITVGDGTGRLRAEVVMGSIQVEVEVVATGTAPTTAPRTAPTTTRARARRDRIARVGRATIGRAAPGAA